MTWMNISLIGRVLDEPRASGLAGKDALAELRLRSEGETITVHVHGKLAEIAESYIHEGALLYVEGGVRSQPAWHVEGRQIIMLGVRRQRAMPLEP